MFFSRFKSLLPKRIAVGVALKTQFSKIKLSRLRGYRKLTHTFARSTITVKLLLIALLAFYFAPYQVTLAIPPIKQAVAKAATEQEQSISAYHLSQPFQLPHPGYISTHFSSWHPGIDVATGLGMPIHPIAAGKVVEVTYGFFGLGHYVVIEHEQGFRSTYGHMGNIFVKVGDQVTQASTIGEVGLTGHTTGPHTHLEIAKDNQYIDPQLVLPGLPEWPTAAGQAPQGQGDVKEDIASPAPAPQKREETTKPTKLNLLDLSKMAAPTQASKTPLELNYFAF